MLSMLVLPVANGILPRPQGGRITGMFLLDHGGRQLNEVGIGQDILACPWNINDENLYPVGVIARIVNITEEVAADEHGSQISVLVVTLEGREHARWHSLNSTSSYLMSKSVERLNFKEMRKEYPVISGAGWQPEGGYTEFRGNSDIPVTIYGVDLKTGQRVSMTGNLGRLVTQEQAHTIEHAIIRALKSCCLCTPRTLIEAMAQETTELKKTVELSIKYTLPEVLGQTASGSCGNPMTNLAQFYLAKEFADNIQAGNNLNQALTQARRATMSQLTDDLGLTMNSGLRVMQGLKKGMSHDDTLLKLDIYKKVIGRFPFEPWG
ncbi:hypothetical protein [Dendrosporobacter sp. 1207_IL3150]|uniref:hypothetical protein n=1 Tax=Dendrosporobacter sp. 1207_IL3150 TaxID=3084054 RepID=UPI002FDA24FE